MTQQATIRKMNETIATFMGGRPISQKYWDLPGRGHTLHGDEYDSHIKYHLSWDWLMPVVEKIAKLCPDDVVHMEFGKTYTRCNLWNLDNGRTHVFDEYKDTPILTVYHAVYKFLQWYQSIQPSQNKQ